MEQRDPVGEGLGGESRLGSRFQQQVSASPYRSSGRTVEMLGFGMLSGLLGEICDGRHEGRGLRGARGSLSRPLPSFRSHPSRLGLKKVCVRSFPSSSGMENGSFFMLSNRFCPGALEGGRERKKERHTSDKACTQPSQALHSTQGQVGEGGGEYWGTVSNVDTTALNVHLRGPQR